MNYYINVNYKKGYSKSIVNYIEGEYMVLEKIFKDLVFRPFLGRFLQKIRLLVVIVSEEMLTPDV
jgi:hypothetical protein